MAEKQGTWGGARDGAGAKSKWQSEGGTKLVRIPIAIESQVLEAARVIDAGVRLISADLAQETVTESSYDEYVTKSSENQFKHELEQMRSQVEKLEGENNFQKNRWELTEKHNNGLAEECRVLKQQMSHFKVELEQMQQERDRLASELVDCRASQPSQPDLESSRDRYLASLRLGKQAPEYKRTKKVIDSFIAFVQSL